MSMAACVTPSSLRLSAFTTFNPTFSRILPTQTRTCTPNTVPTNNSICNEFALGKLRERHETRFGREETTQRLKLRLELDRRDALLVALALEQGRQRAVDELLFVDGEQALFEERVVLTRVASMLSTCGVYSRLQ